VNDIVRRSLGLFKGKGKGSPYSIRALGPELIPVIGSEPAGDLMNV